MPEALHVIALISGGKDSLFSLLHCLANGHRVVALANLYPAPPARRPGEDGEEGGAGIESGRLPGAEHDQDDEDGQDSFMYQTVGHKLLPLYGAALGIPLYRGEIRGGAVNTALHYTRPSGAREPAADETESLPPLLRRIQAQHPAANALATGAVLSTYQRTRIEHVAARLGLVSLAPLWQFPSLPPRYAARDLLADLRAVGLEARVAKVAGAAAGEGALWADVCDVYGAAAACSGPGGPEVLGEGGEYETLVVDGPRGVWKGRIEVETSGVVAGGGGAAWVRVLGGKMVPKDGAPVGQEESESWKKDLRIPDLWDSEFKMVLEQLQDPRRPGSQQTCTPEFTPSHRQTAPSGLEIPVNHISSTPSTLTIVNMVSPESGSSHRLQLASILSSLAKKMQTCGLQPPPGYSTDPLPSCAPFTLIHTTLVLRSMAHFADIADTYAGFFGAHDQPFPPSRVTVAAGNCIPAGTSMMLSVHIARRDAAPAASPRPPRGLWVQSRSYWAPANIGPYAQAVAYPLPAQEIGDKLEARDEPAEPPELVWLAGQIPLVPASMDMFDGLAPTSDSARAPDGSVPALQRYTEPPVPGFTPATAPANAFAGQTALALQHLWRVGRALLVRWWLCGVAYVAACPAAETEVAVRARTALAAWKAAHDVVYASSAAAGVHDADDADSADDDNDDAFDVWDLQCGAARWRLAERGISSCTSRPDALPSRPSSRPHLPGFSAVQTVRHGDDAIAPAPKLPPAPVPPCFAVEVHALPRAAPVEWWSVGAACASAICVHTVAVHVPSPGSDSPGVRITAHVTTLAAAPALRFVAFGVPAAPHLACLDAAHGARCWAAVAPALAPARGASAQRATWEHCTVWAARGLGAAFAASCPIAPVVVPCWRVWGQCAQGEGQGAEMQELQAGAWARVRFG